jgi:hypothetical protein
MSPSALRVNELLWTMPISRGCNLEPGNCQVIMSAKPRTVLLDTSVVEALESELKRRNLRFDDQSIPDLVVSHLRQLAAPGFDRDTVTALNTRQKFILSIKVSFGRGGQDSGQSLMCVKRISSDSSVAGDDDLRSFSRELQRLYGADAVYRWGTNEFVVWPCNGSSRPPDPPTGTLHARLDFDTAGALPPDLLVGWITLSIQMALNRSTPEGISLRCRSPQELLSLA